MNKVQEIFRSATRNKIGHIVERPGVGWQAKTEHPCRVYHQMCEVQAVLSEVCTARGQPQKARQHMETAERCMAAVAAMDACQSYVQQLAAMQAGMKPDASV